MLVRSSSRRSPSACSSYRLRSRFLATRSTVHQRLLSFWLHTPCKPSMATIILMCTKPTFLAAIACFLNGLFVSSHCRDHFLNLGVGNCMGLFFNGLSQSFRQWLYACRVMDQHKMTRDQWEERVIAWFSEHKGMMRLVTSSYIV